MSDTQTNDEAVMPLSALTGQAEGGGEGGDVGSDAESLLASSVSKKRSPLAGMLVILMVIVVASAGLYFMRRIGMGGAFTFNDVDIEVPVALGNSEQYEVVMHDIREEATEKQVPLENVKKNPFYIARSASPGQEVASDPSDAGEAERAARERAEAERAEAERLEKARLAGIEKELETLKLRSIMGGSRPMAMIGDDLLQVGARVGEYFRISKISDRGVELQTDRGETYQLQLGTD
ncbi:MAG: hypothetical protein ACF8NJ_10145 [Phycisphaerales bacterium JB038]